MGGGEGGHPRRGRESSDRCTAQVQSRSQSVPVLQLAASFVMVCATHGVCVCVCVSQKVVGCLVWTLETTTRTHPRPRAISHVMIRNRQTSYKPSTVLDRLTITVVLTWGAGQSHDRRLTTHDYETDDPVPSPGRRMDMVCYITNPSTRSTPIYGYTRTCTRATGRATRPFFFLKK